MFRPKWCKLVTHVNGVAKRNELTKVTRLRHFGRGKRVARGRLQKTYERI
nr:MAG TPA: hypothetical protein [Microviridae sp.]